MSGMVWSSTKHSLFARTHNSFSQLVNDNGMINITAFDYSKPIGQKLWLDTIKNLTSTGAVDGFYGDTMQVYAVENNETGLWELCKKSHHTCCEMNATKAAAYNAGKLSVMNAANDFLGKGAVFFKITDTLTGGGRNDPLKMATTISDALANQTYVQISAGDQNTDHDPKDTSSACDENMIASFLLGVERGAFIGCNGWDPDHMGRPLGNPLAPMHTSGNTLWRNFSTGTSVTWDIRNKKGTVHWSK